ncbi:hypothetical protein MCETE4_00073 [Acidimicrobiia bacterium]
MELHLELAEAALGNGPRHRFSDWPITDVPFGPAGVYAIWDANSLLYVGMSWRDRREDPRAKGVHSRLASHASGRRSGDQFNVYVCDHYVIPDLDAAQLKALRDGERILDRLTKQYIGELLEFSVWIAPDGATARAVEHELRGAGLSDFGKPRLNPRSTAHQQSH